MNPGPEAFKLGQVFRRMDLMPVLLLLVLGLPVAGGAAMLVFVMVQVRRECRMIMQFPDGDSGNLPEWLEPTRPARWLAVRVNDVAEVQNAFRMRDPEPCSFHDGVTGEKSLFLAVVPNGWTLITGLRVPDPEDDVDAFFRFLMEASRKLGHIQYFSANPFQHHHAWIKAEHGSVLRAYAWAGSTLWNQGPMTEAERDLGLECLDYGDHPGRNGAELQEIASVNVEKVHLLAARWSFDPGAAALRQQAKSQGVAGEASFRA